MEIIIPNWVIRTQLNGPIDSIRFNIKIKKFKKKLKLF